MSTGVIKVANTDGVYVIKMMGDVRLTLSLSFDEFIEAMFTSKDYCSVIFDLSEAIAIDSTTLGLMAKISLKGRALKHHIDPIVISVNPGVTRLLESMGFTEILQVVASADIATANFEPLEPNDDIDEERLREKVLEAHHSLIALNARNHDTFKELIYSLEQN